MARRTTPPGPPRIQGGLIGIGADGIVGWARDADRPEAPLQIRLYAGEQLVGEAVANQFEDERVRTLVGPGVPGFSARLAVAPGGSYPLALSVRDLAGNLLGAPLIVHRAGELAGLVGMAPMLNYEGHMDGVFDGALRGWARNTDAPDEVVALELLDTGVVVSYADAQVLRPDLRDAGLHHGMYGYAFDLPLSLLDGKAHSLTVRVSGTNVVLRGGPIAFGPLASSALIAQMSALRTEVAALRTLVDGLIAPDGLVQRRVMRVLSERVSAQAEIERERMERDMEALRRMVFDIAERGKGAGPEQYNVAPDNVAPDNVAPAGPKRRAAR